MRRPWLFFGPAALAAAGLAIALTLASDHEEYPLIALSLGLFVGGSFILAGLIGWTRRPETRIGKLMVAVGFGIFVGSLSTANDSIPFTIGRTWGVVFIAIFLHLLLSYPTGRLESRRARIVVASGYVLVIVGPLLAMMFEKELDCGSNPCPPNAFAVTSSDTALTVVVTVLAIAAVSLFTAVLVLLLGRWRRSTPALRRTLRPVFLAGELSLVLFLLFIATTPIGGATSAAVLVALIVAFTSVPYIFLGGLLQTTLARGSGVDTIFRDIPERASPGDVQLGLRRALRDPTLEVLYWYDEGGHFVDVEGNLVELPRDTATRVVTRLEYSDMPVAALVHDAALRQEPELLESLAGAARIALERDKLLVEGKARAERYRALLQAMPDLMFRISRDGRYLAYNAPNQRDLIVEEVLGLTVHDRLPPDLAERVLAAGRAAIEQRETQVIEYGLEFEGETRHYEGRFAASGDDEFLMIVREITDRKRQQQELEESRARIVAAGDKARRRLERDLHDGAQQRLVSLSLSLRLAQGQVRKNPAAAETLLDASREELAQALEELRELARGIHPAVLSDRGLEAALETLASRSPLPVTISGPDGGFPPAVEAAAYYVVSEALANVTKYAQASSVKVTVGRTNGYALVEVEDDGVGGADPARGSGLHGLADRVSALKGSLQIDSRPGLGTRIRAVIPLGVGSDG